MKYEDMEKDMGCMLCSPLNPRCGLYKRCFGGFTKCVDDEGMELVFFADGVEVSD